MVLTAIETLKLIEIKMRYELLMMLTAIFLFRYTTKMHHVPTNVANSNFTCFWNTTKRNMTNSDTYSNKPSNRF